MLVSGREAVRGYLAATHLTRPSFLVHLALFLEGEGVGDPRPHQLVAPICLNEATAPTRFGMEGAPKGSAGPHASSLALTL